MVGTESDQGGAADDPQWHLDADLHAAGYFYPPERTQVTRHMIRTIMSKPAWSSREVKAVRGMIRTLVKPRPRGR